MDEHDDYEIVQIDEDIERDIKFLTLIFKSVYPKIDSGETYSILLSVALGMMSGEMYEEEDAEQIGQQIRETVNLNREKVWN